MPDILEVALNRDGPHSIAVESSFETDDEFDIELRNHGASLHVHLHLDEDLSRAASIDAPNRFVDEGGVDRVRVDVADAPRPVKGRLKIVTGYGSETSYVTVSIVDSEEDSTGVQVDERLAKPQPRSTEPAVAPEDLPIVALAAVALLVAVLAGVLVDSLVAVAGVALVSAGIVVAVVLLRR